MTPGRAQRWRHRWPWVLAMAGLESGSERRFRRLELLGLANGAVFLAALAALLVFQPLAPDLYKLGLLVLFLACCLNALVLRRRFWAVLSHELHRRRQTEQEARAADRAKGQFLANVSHEIRTPMNGILGMTEVLLRGGPRPDQRDQLEVIRTSAEALLTLVIDILDLSRIEAGHLLLRPADFQLRALAGDVVRLLGPRAAEREVDLRLDIDPALPDGLHGDPARLRQVMLNLVGNAVRFTRQGTVTVTIKPWEEAGKAPALHCQVRDTGVGIRPEVQARLFQPFAQSESSASRQLGGTGLGLVISRSLVELMGGEIGFESTRGVGSTFWFRVPLVRALGAGPQTPMDLPQATEARRRARRERRVLVVDDRVTNRAVALAQLRGLGYTAEAVESGEEALVVLEEQPFDAVLLDSEMPGLDGFETCRRLRQREGEGRRIPVIAITAHALPEVRERCLAAGMDDYLTKPFTSADLTARLDRWLGLETRPAEPTGAKTDERLAELRALGEKTGHDVMTQVVAAFLQQGEADLATLRDALPRGDGKAAGAAAHALAGSSGVLGAVELAAIASDIATLALRGDLAACTARLPALEREYRDFVRKLSP